MSVTHAIERTVDDLNVDMLPAGVAPAKAKAPSGTARLPELPEAVKRRVEEAKTAPEEPLSDAAPPTSRKKHRTPWLAIGLTFILGVGVAVSAQKLLGRGEAERLAYIERTKKALADRHYTGPKGENVEELVNQGLTQWPDDPTLRDIRADAVQQMVTRAMTAHTGGDVEGARDGARKALQLLPNDYSAKLLADQYDEELRSLGTPAGLATGTPRVLFTVPKTAHPAERFDAVAHVLPRAAGPHAKIEGTKMSLRQTLSTEGTALPIDAASPGTFTAHVSVPAAGRHYVVFEASVEGKLLRAERPVDVGP
jgi:hypothetical protein